MDVHAFTGNSTLHYYDSAVCGHEPRYLAAWVILALVRLALVTACSCASAL